MQTHTSADPRLPPNPFDLDPGPEPEPVVTVSNEEALREREAELDRREAELAARAPREVEALTDAIVEGQIISEYFVSAWDACQHQPNITVEAQRALRATTICVLILRNGFPITGTSVAPSPEAYDPATGRKWAKEDALRKLWFAEEYALQNRRMGIDYVAPVEQEPVKEKPSKAKKAAEPEPVTADGDLFS